MTARIAFIDQTGAIGGAELVLLDIAEAYRESCAVILFDDGPFAELLKERCVRVEIFSMSGNLSSVRRESGVVKGAGSLFSVLSGSLRLASAIRDVDLVYANTQKAAVIGGLAAWLKRKKMIWHLHDIISEEHFSPSQIKVITFVLKHFVHSVAITGRAASMPSTITRPKGSAAMDGLTT